MRSSVLLADDHALFRQRAKAVLTRKGFIVVGEAADGQEAVELTRRFSPEIALIDVAMPVLNGLEATRQIVELCGITRVIALTVHREELYVISALRAGARGYIVKNQLADELLLAIAEVRLGKIWVSGALRYVSVESWISSAGTLQ